MKEIVNKQPEEMTNEELLEALKQSTKELDELNKECFKKYEEIDN